MDNTEHIKTSTHRLFILNMFFSSFTDVLEQGTYAAENPTQVDWLHQGSPRLCCCYYVLCSCVCVKKNFAEKEQNVQLKKQNTKKTL